jgi:hypothetical protein
MDDQYRDGKLGDTVAARTPFGQAVRMSEKRQGSNGREKLAQWISRKTGDQFSTVVANRMWKRIMGKGIYEPVDEYLSPVKTTYPELVSYLGALIVQMNYDLRAFQNVLLLTRTFQFDANPNPSSIEGGDDFHGRKIESQELESPRFRAPVSRSAKNVSYLYMSGGMSHLDTFDPKPKNKGVMGKTEAIPTKVDGLMLGNYLPKTAELIEHVCVVNSMNSTQGAHEQGAYIMHTSYDLRGSIKHPGLGA